MTSQPGQQTITIHILLSISESIGNQKMKLVQLIECNWKWDSSIWVKCKWPAPRDMVKNELPVTSYELRVTSYKFKGTSWNSKVRVQIHEFRFTSCEFNFTSYEFKSTIY